MKLNLTVVLLLSFGALVSNKSHASGDWTLFERVCIDNLYDQKQVAQIMESKGWKNFPAARWKRIPMMGHVATLGLIERQTNIYIAKDSSRAIILGYEDNDIASNVRCYFTTSDSTSNFKTVIERAKALLDPIKPVITTGSRYKNSNYEWWSGTWKKNISSRKPFTAMTINHYPNGNPRSNVFFNIAVVGIVP